MWRPEGWDNPYKQDTPEHWSDNYEVIQSKEWHIFEAGADAMLGALRKKGMPISYWRQWEDIASDTRYIAYTPAIGEQIGTLVFIPDEPQHIVPEE